MVPRFALSNFTWKFSHNKWDSGVLGSIPPEVTPKAVVRSRVCLKVWMWSSCSGFQMWLYWKVVWVSVGYLIWSLCLSVVSDGGVVVARVALRALRRRGGIMWGSDNLRRIWGILLWWPVGLAASQGTGPRLSTMPCSRGPRAVVYPFLYIIVVVVVVLKPFLPGIPNVYTKTDSTYSVHS